MIPKVDDCYFHKRINNVLIAVTTTGVEVPVVKFKQNFIDIQILDQLPFAYMQKYIEMFPDLVEVIEPKKQTDQLTLF